MQKSEECRPQSRIITLNNEGSSVWDNKLLSIFFFENIFSFVQLIYEFWSWGLL